MPACLATSVAFAPGSINAATHVSFSERDQRRRLSTEVMTSIRFMALWLSLLLATLSYATPPRAQGGASRTDTIVQRVGEINPHELGGLFISAPRVIPFLEERGEGSRR
jgi:hypothetical protein